MWGISACSLPESADPLFWRLVMLMGRNIFVSFKPPRPGTEPRTLAWNAAVLTTTLGPPSKVVKFYSLWNWGWNDCDVSICLQQILITQWSGWVIRLRWWWSRNDLTIDGWQLVRGLLEYKLKSQLQRSLSYSTDLCNNELLRSQYKCPLYCDRICVCTSRSQQSESTTDTCQTKSLN